MRLAAMHVLPGLARLLEVYKRPEHMPKEPEKFAAIYADVCSALSPDQFNAACDEYLRGGARWMATPGQLLTLGRGTTRSPNGTGGSLEDRYRVWENAGFTDASGGPFTPCPVCQAVVAPNAAGRLEVRHDHQQHFVAGVGYSGPRTGPVNERGVMVAATGPRP